MSIGLQHDEIRDLLAVYAVDAIADTDERDAVAQHLETCSECRAEVAAHYEALTSLVPQSEDELEEIWSGVRARIRTEETDDAPGSVVAFRPRPRARWLVAGAAAVAAVSVLVTVVATGDGGSGSPAQTAAIVAAAPEVADVRGQAELFAPASDAGRLVLELEDVPDAPAGHHYAVWVLRPGTDVEMEPIGAFSPQDGSARLDLPLPGPGEYVAVDISVQEDGGSPVHSGTSLAGASFAS